MLCLKVLAGSIFYVSCNLTRFVTAVREKIFLFLTVTNRCLALQTIKPHLIKCKLKPWNNRNKLPSKA